MPLDPRLHVLDAARRTLLDTSRCPACGAVLSRSVCAACGLDTTRHGAAIWTASVDAVAALDHRVAVVRAAVVGATVDGASTATVPGVAPLARTSSTEPAGPGGAPAAPPVVPGAQPEPPASPDATVFAPPSGTRDDRGVPAAAGPSAPRPARTAPPQRPVGATLPAGPTPPHPPVRPSEPVARPGGGWSVQTVLQVLGAGLLATASIVFLVFSWGLLSLAARAAAVAAGTLVVLGLASWLRRRRLTQSAEAVGALGAVLVGLDAWAVHATGLVGSVDGVDYAAVACAVCAVVLGTWGRLSGIRAGTVAAALLAPAVPVVLLPHADGPTAATLLLLASTAVSSVRFLPGPTLVAERRTLGVLAVLTTATAAATALTAALSSTDPAWHAAGALTAVAVAALGQALPGRAVVDGPPLSTPRPGAAPWTDVARRLWAAGAGAAAATAGATAAHALDVPVVLGAVAVAAAACAVLRTRPLPVHLRTGAHASTVTAVVLGLVPTAALVPVTVTAVARPDLVAATPDAFVDVLSVLAVVALLLLASWADTAPWAWLARQGAAWLTALAVVAAAAVAGALLVAAPSTGVVVALSMLAVVAVLASGPALAPLPLVGRVLRGGRVQVRTTTAVALLGALVAADGAAAPSAVVLTLAAGATVLARRWWTGPAAAPALAAVATAFTGCALGSALEAFGAAHGTAWTSAAAAVVAGTVLAATPPWSAPWAGTRTRPALLLVGAGAAVGGWSAGLAWPAGPGAHGAFVVLVLVTAAACGLVALRGPGRVAVDIATGASAALPVVVAGGLWAVHSVTGLGEARAVVVAVVAVGVAAALLSTLPAAFRTTPQGRPGALACEGSGAVLVAVGLLASAAHGPGTQALALVVAAVGAGACALRADRRPLRWVALGLAVLASWTLLGADDVRSPEPYLVPLGLVLTGVAVRRWRRGGRVAELLAAGTLLVALPGALVGGTVDVAGLDVPRVGIAAAIAVALVAVAARARHQRSAVAGDQPPALVLSGVASLLAVVGPARHAVVLAVASWGGTGSGAARRGTADWDTAVAGTEVAGPAVTGWAGAGALVVVAAWAAVAALVLEGARRVAVPLVPPAHRRAVDLTGSWLVLAAAAVPLALTLDAGPAGVLRLVGLAAVAVGLGLRGAGLGGAPDGTRLVQGVVLACATVFCGLVHPWPVPADAWFVLLGAALLAFGLVRMHVDPRVGSWAALGAGLVGTLAVPLVAALAVPEQWRTALSLVGAVVAVGIGATRRWQAPFVVGGVALSVQALVQLSPTASQVLAATGWWPVLAVGGAGLLGLGLTYERRLREAREAAVFVRQMR